MYFDGENIILSDNPLYNYIELDYYDFLLEPISANYKKSKGANSCVFILKDPNEEEEDRVIKFCKSPISQGVNKRIKRFRREIKAFQRISAKNFRNIISFFGDGTIEIDGEIFEYIIIEKAEDDLATYLDKNVISLQQKVQFCVNILTGINELHSVGVYHRDIKHDNVLLVSGEWKITDLGLVKFRGEDKGIDYANEKIGPYGWLSPEVINKAYTFGKNREFIFDCVFDEKSDVFQLGKLFWFICQGNLPVGQIQDDDFLIDDNDFFHIIRLMVEYEKDRRPNIAEVIKLLKPVRLKYVV